MTEGTFKEIVLRGNVMKKMGKRLYRMIAVVLGTGLLSGALPVSAADGTKSALDAFYALQDGGDSRELNTGNVERTALLDAVMGNSYGQIPADAEKAALMAGELRAFCLITNGDLAAYASEHGMKMAQVRNAYYKALAIVLQAEIAANPGTEEKYRNIQTILSLFLTGASDPAGSEEQEAVRSRMTPEYGREIADGYGLPENFVDFIIMDSSWQDSDWKNDNAWREAAGWDSAADVSDKGIYIGSKDTGSSDAIRQMQQKLIDLGYLHGTADGVFGPRTQAALIEFQLANGMKASGIYTAAEETMLSGTDLVRRGDYGEEFWDPDDPDDLDDLYEDEDDRDDPDADRDDNDDADDRDDDQDADDADDSYDDADEADAEYDDGGDYDDDGGYDDD